jgi:hypothetical protein
MYNSKEQNKSGIKAAVKNKECFHFKSSIFTMLDE